MRKAWKAGWIALALLAGAAPPAVAAEGEQLFKSKCTTCHAAQKVIDGVHKVEADKRQAHFQKFLASHFAPDAAQRQAIVDYLIATAK
jgi:cytochrome c5